MPEGINEGTIQAVKELVENPKGVVAAAEEAASTVKNAAEDIASGKSGNARTYVRDARGRFASAVKGAAKTATTAGVAAETANLLSSKNSSSDDIDQGNQQTNGPSRTTSVANPGANSPAGRIDLPSITPAEDIAQGVDVNSFSDTRGVKGSWGDAGGENLSNRKLNRIITILESILSVEKRSISVMGTGFRNVENAVYAGFNAQANRDQAQQLENNSSGGGGSFFGSSSMNPGKFAMGSLKSLGVAALGAFAAGAAIDAFEGMSKDNKSNEAKGHPSQDTADHDAVFGAYKNKYGKRWAQMFVDDIFDQLSKKKGFQGDLADSKQAAAGDMYLAIKELFNKSSKEDQGKIIQQIAYLLKLKPEQVQAQIVEVNKPSRQMGRTIAQAATNSVVNSTAWAVTGAQKLAGLVGGGALNYAGSALSYIGATKAGDYLQNKGNDLTDSEMRSANEAQLGVKNWLRNNTSMETQLDIGQHQDAYKWATVGTDTATALLGPGKLKGAKLFWGATAGIGSMIGNEGKYDVFAYARQSDLQLEGMSNSVKKISNGKKLSPEAESRAKKALSFFQSKGYSKEQAEGIVANLLVESNYTLDPHQAQIGGGGGYGIAQWTSKDRKNKFKEIEGTSLEQSTFDQQLDFVNWELNNTEKKAGDKLRNAKTVSEASQIVTRDYERPAAIDQQSAYRASYAEAISKQFDAESLKPQTQIASSTVPSSPINISQGGTNISRNTTIQSATAAAPSFLQDSVASSI